MSLESRLKKLEASRPSICPYSVWQRSLTLEQLENAIVRGDVVRELQQILNSQDLINQDIFDRLGEEWHPKPVHRLFPHLSDEEIVAELEAVKQRSPMDPCREAELTAKWRTYYLTGELPEITQ